MVSRLHALVVRTSQPETLATYWGCLLGWLCDGLVLTPDDAPMRMAFEPSARTLEGLNQVHLHLTSSHVTQEATVDRALELGATHLDVGQLPDEDTRSDGSHRRAGQK